jgi:preprotein translocase subunit SecA
MDEQRKTIYSWRQKILERKGIDDELVALAEDAVEYGVDVYCPPKTPADAWDMDGLCTWFGRKFGEPVTIPTDVRSEADAIADLLIQRVKEIFERRCAEFGREAVVEFGRSLLLRVIDIRWKDHLHAMDVLKSGISLRSYAQKDPKIEYKTEAGIMFEEMMVAISDKVSDLFFRVHVEEKKERRISGIWQQGEARHDEFNAAAVADGQRQAAQSAGEVRPVEPIRVEGKVGRNDPCPCRSGKKYKHCCGRR